MSVHRHETLLGALVGLTVAATAAPGLAEAPQTVTVNGHELMLNGAATRQVLIVETYSVALYLPQPSARVEEIDHPDVPKAFHIEVLYDGPGAGQEEIPEDWREELVPALTEEQLDVLRQVFADIQAGDVIWVTYAPETGTAVTLNNEHVLDDPGHEPISALVSTWLGPDPIAEGLRDELLAGGA